MLGDIALWGSALMYWAGGAFMAAVAIQHFVYPRGDAPRWFVSVVGVFAVVSAGVVVLGLAEWLG